MSSLLQLLLGICLVHCWMIHPILATTTKSSSTVTSIQSVVLHDDAGDNDVGGDGDDCQFVGKVVIAQLASMDPDERFYFWGSMLVNVNRIIVDHINKKRCGIHMEDGNYYVEMRFYDDLSEIHGTVTVANELVQKTTADVINPNQTNNYVADVIFAGFSSFLSMELANITNPHQRLVLAPLATAPSVYVDRDYTFGILPQGNARFKNAMKVLEQVGAQTIGTIVEDDVAMIDLCGGAAQSAEAVQMDVLEAHNVPKEPNATTLEPYVRQLAQDNPDVVVGCVHDVTHVVQAMRSINWSPKALIFLSFEGLGTDRYHLLDCTTWDASLNIIDPVTGYTPQELMDRYTTVTNLDEADVPWQMASFAAPMSITVQAIEATNSFDNDVLTQYIAATTFSTVLGDIDFDDNGQNESPALTLQYSGNGTTNIVYPEVVRTAEIVYPMPTWDERDCIHESPCGLGSMEEGGGGTDSSEYYCGPQGRCVCTNPDLVSSGSGVNAACVTRETYNFIPDALRYSGYGLFGVMAMGCILAGGWMYKNRTSWIVRASQPTLLLFILIGCFVSSFSIPFLGNETEYRVLRDDVMWEFTDDENPDVQFVDASCMVAPWLYGIGFSIAFSALFAKIMRVIMISNKKKKKTSDNVHNKDIVLGDVAHIMAVMLMIEIIILISWQVVSPYRWEREVLDEENGIPVESVGRCSSESGHYFFITMIVFHIVALFYALVLSFQSQYIHSDFAESQELATTVAFMFQVMILAIPIAILVEDSNSIYYFVQVGAVFLQNFTVLALIFVPKVLKNRAKEEDLAKKREMIPLAALTHSKWDEGVDAINELLHEEGAVNQAMSDVQRASLENIKTLLLNGNKLSSKDNKLAFIPKELLQKRYTKANRFIMNEFGGVNADDSRSVLSQETMSLGSDTVDDGLNLSSINLMGEAVRRRSGGNTFVPPEFSTLSTESKQRLRTVLSWSSLKQWDFNVFEIAELADGNPLPLIGWAILGSPYSQLEMAKACGEEVPLKQLEGYYFTDKKSGFNIPMGRLCDYLRVIGDDYKDNPYHNVIHATDVMQTSHALLQMMLVGDFQPTSEEILALLLGAAVHDVKHPGRTNAFQENARTGYALTYNGKAVLENMHISHAFTRMLDINPYDDGSTPNLDKTSELHLFCNMKKKQFSTVRDKMIEAIMNTDMTRHFELVSTMKTVAMRLEEGYEENTDQDAKAKDTWEVMMYILHMADISGQAKPIPLALQWTDRCMKEFFVQGDHERELGMTISPLCDRRTVVVADSQVGFISFVVKPAYQTLASLVPQVGQNILAFVDGNLDYYELLKSGKGHEKALSDTDGDAKGSERAFEA